MNLYDLIDSFMADLANALWGTPLVILLLGGGFYFSIISKLVPFKYLNHAISILLGKKLKIFGKTSKSFKNALKMDS